MTEPDLPHAPEVEVEPFPCALAPVLIPSDPGRIIGAMFLAAGPGPHPTVVLLHGFPGHEKNLDLAHFFRRAGFNALVVHYRGAWGSPGLFSFANAIQDVGNVLVYLRDPRQRSSLRCDGERIILVGHSMGAFAALLTAVDDASILGVASLAGYNFGRVAQTLRSDEALRSQFIRDLETEVIPLAGAIPAHLTAELIEHADVWDLTGHASRLARQALLLVAAAADRVATTESHFQPLVQALQDCDPPRLEVHRIPSDHVFSESRIELGRIVLAWLNQLVDRPDHRSERP